MNFLLNNTCASRVITWGVLWEINNHDDEIAVKKID
jgi:hypothetical protein